MNNGCYGLTKGQDSATADRGSTSKKGAPNLFESIDLCELAIQLGAGFVARGFSGDKQQLVPLLKAAMSHEGFSLVDVISPLCYLQQHYNINKELSVCPKPCRGHGHTGLYPAAPGDHHRKH
jgi:pyruvate/2-oxoacid:ferredoxin oxidoreductase beta subunit